MKLCWLAASKAAPVEARGGEGAGVRLEKGAGGVNL